MSDVQEKTVFLASGGTGGHMFPAKALAQELLKRGYEPHFITDKRHTGWLDLEGSQLTTLDIVSPAGSIFKKFFSMGSMLRYACTVNGLMKRYKPQAVIAFGGYPCIPTLLAAVWRGVPIILHEQNAVLGRVNKLFAGNADAIATAYKHVKHVPEAQKDDVVLVGNPVRQAIKECAKSAFPKHKKDTRLHLFVIGGSQGATILSNVVPKAIAQLDESQRQNIAITQQCRPSDIEQVTQAYKAIGINDAVIKDFFDDVQDCFKNAHIVIGRAGASTIAELTVIGRASLLVPFKKAKDNHQFHNTEDLRKANGTVVLEEEEFTPSKLAEHIQTWIQSTDELKTLAGNAASLGIVNADEQLADLVQTIINASDEENNHDDNSSRAA